MIIIINYDNITFRFCCRRHDVVFLSNVINLNIYVYVTKLLSVKMIKRLIFLLILTNFKERKNGIQVVSVFDD